VIDIQLGDILVLCRLQASGEEESQRIQLEAPPKGLNGSGGRGTSSCGDLALCLLIAKAFVDFCVTFFPRAPFFRSSCVVPAGAEANALVAELNPASGLGGTGVG